jgi:hypothetical protein
MILQQGINEMLEHLEIARSTLRNPVHDDERIEFMQNTHSGGPGRPKIEFNHDLLAEALRLRGPAGVARSVPASARTIRRRALDYGIQTPGRPVYTIEEDQNGQPTRRWSPHNSSLRLTPISVEQLDAMLTDALTSCPEFGRSMSIGYFRAYGIRISRQQLRESYLRVQGGPAIVGHRSIERREYHVDGPNSLWHHDGQHGTTPFV